MDKDDNKNQNNDIFDDAFNEAMKQESSIPEVIESKDVDDEIMEQALDIANADKTFKDIEHYLLNKGAARFLKVLQGCPDKDYLKYYPKMLEYFKPKISRVEPDEGEDSSITNIQVNIMTINSDGEITKINLEDGD